MRYKDWIKQRSFTNEMKRAARLALRSCTVENITTGTRHRNRIITFEDLIIQLSGNSNLETPRNSSETLFSPASNTRNDKINFTISGFVRSP